MKPSSKPSANPAVVLRVEFDDWAVLFNPDTADAFGINPVGVAVWKLIDGRRSLEEIVVEVKGLFANVPDTAFAEMTAFVDKLADKGFVRYELEGAG